MPLQGVVRSISFETKSVAGPLDGVIRPELSSVSAGGAPGRHVSAEARTVAPAIEGPHRGRGEGLNQFSRCR